MLNIYFQKGICLKSIKEDLLKISFKGKENYYFKMIVADMKENFN